jgi:prepilin-type N-terminal cleavage/methylation domain-containing protein
VTPPLEQSEHGFTLIEIMVAVVIMSLILTFAFQAYQGIQNAYARVAVSSNRDRAAGIVLDRMERELVGTVLVEREDGSDPLLQRYFFFADSKTYSDSEADELRFVTRTASHPPGEPSAPIAVVTYGAIPSQSGQGLSLLRQQEALPDQLAKEISWVEPQIVADNVGLFLLRYHGDDQTPSEGWDSTAAERLDQLPATIVLTVALWESDPNGLPVLGEEHTRVITLPVRPFKLSPEGQKDAKACGEGMTVKQCVQTFAQQITQTSSSLTDAIREATEQVQDPCWSSAQPSPALQRLKILMGGVPGFDAGECK